MKKFRVTALCTTDDPTDDLAPHRQLASDPNVGTMVFPAFRPDKGLALGKPEVWNAWTDKLGAAAGTDTDTLADLLEALDRRIDVFPRAGLPAVGPRAGELF